jgi:CheY-like chemotaxis protein
MKHIVIYEEDYLTRTLLREWLSDAGYRVHLNMPREASRKWTVDLVIVSVYMPKHAGLSCVEGIKKTHPDAPIIAISGQFRAGLTAAGATAQSLGVQQVIAKPLVRRDLVTAVRGIIGEPK